MTKLYFFCLSLLIVCCANPDCSNSNPVFESEKPESQSYRTELAKQLRLSSDKSFFVDQYVSDKDGDFLYVKITGEDLCATGIFKVREPHPKLANIKQARGIGYRGAKLRGFSFDSMDGELIFNDVESIVD